MDEISTVGETQITELRAGQIVTQTWTPEQFGFERTNLEDLVGGDVQTCASVLSAVLAGERGPRRDIVVLNAAAAIYVSGKAADMAEGIARAQASLDEGAARAKLEALKEASWA
jgi:anthranilate phosphoribosyltransferase